MCVLPAPAASESPLQVARKSLCVWTARMVLWRVVLARGTNPTRRGRNSVNSENLFKLISTSPPLHVTDCPVTKFRKLKFRGPATPRGTISGKRYSMAARSGWAPDTSNVEWCEAVTHLYRLHPCCAELVNTVTNVCAFTAAMLGLRRAHARRLPGAILFTEAVLAVVAVGSAIFHATRSYYGEMLDEFPMSVMA